MNNKAYIQNEADAAELLDITKGLAANDRFELLVVVSSLCRVVNEQQRQIENLKEDINFMKEKETWSH